MPPGRGAASTTLVAIPDFCKAYAVASPEMPAPTTRASTRSDIRVPPLRLEGLGKERPRGQLLLLQVRIKNHRQVANKNAAQPRGADFLVVDHDQAILLRHFQVLEFRREVFVKMNAELFRDFVFHD